MAAPTVPPAPRFGPLRRVLKGIDAIREAHEIQRRNLRLEKWPYEWVYPPPDSERVHFEATIDVSTMVPGTQTLIAEYQVQNNYNFQFTGLVQLYLGQNSFVPGDGSIVWFLDVNIPLGVRTPQGYPVQGYDRSGIPKGGFVSGVIMPYPLAPKPEPLAPLDFLRSKATIQPNINQGRLVTIFDGWLIPV